MVMADPGMHRASLSRGGCLWLSDEGRVPHISRVFREMWDTTTLDRAMHRMIGSQRAGAVVSHISRKTSEMWGTRPSSVVRI